MNAQSNHTNYSSENLLNEKPAAYTPAIDWGERIDMFRFYGRSPELETLRTSCSEILELAR